MQVDFESELWTWEARQGDNWVFVSLPAEESEHIRELTGSERRGFGSVRVEVTIGATIWRTSIFPDGTRGVYVLPVKQAVRKARSLTAGDTVAVSIRLL